MDANTPITVAPQKYSGPNGQAETRSSPSVAGSSPQRRAFRDKGESASVDEREAAELVKIEGRLMAEYGASLGTDTVIRCMAEAVDHFDEAPIRTYVMLLVERRATAQLRNETRRATADPGEGQGRPS